MSRALRRAKEEREIRGRHDQNASAAVDVEAESLNMYSRSSENRNPYDLLPDDECSEIDGRASSDHEMPKEVSHCPTSVPCGNQTSSKKKKKKRRKEKPVQSVDQSVLEEDEIDKSIREVNKMLGEYSLSSSSLGIAESEAIIDFKALFSADPRCLNPDEEMRRRLGAFASSNGRRQRAHERKSRKTWLVAPRQQWVAAHKSGLNMLLLDKTSTTLMFSFEHNPSYQKVQFQFLDAVESFNHEVLMALLQTNPYHIDTLLQVSEICKMNDDTAMAAELIERSLYAFESSFHSMFNISQGNCRLDYKRSENRPFFLALFRHIQFVAERGCFRTALEFCKVLLGLDPKGDPLCVFLMIDYFALKAEQYDYLIRIYNELDSTRSLSLLPNFSFSVALAYYKSGSIDMATNLLKKALLMFPSMLSTLVEKCDVQLDVLLTKSTIFDPAKHLNDSLALKQLVLLYACRCSSLWKDTAVLNWLTETCQHLLTTKESWGSQEVECTERRKSRYSTSPRNVLRHIVISDHKEVLGVLPVEIRHQPILMHDPLPPMDSLTGYIRPTRPAASNASPHGVFSLFFRSLMPSFGQSEVQQAEENLPEVGHAAGGADQARPADQEGQLLGGAQRLMHAMRELLSTMTYRGDLEEHANNIDENHENGDWEEGPENPN